MSARNKNSGGFCLACADRDHDAKQSIAYAERLEYEQCILDLEMENERLRRAPAAYGTSHALLRKARELLNAPAPRNYILEEAGAKNRRELAARIETYLSNTTADTGLVEAQDFIGKGDS